MFEKKIYALVDPKGLAREHFAQGLSAYIMKTGGSIRPMIVDTFGNVLSVKFGDGTMSVEHIPGMYRKYFEEVEPLAIAAITLPIRPKAAAEANIINFPGTFSDEPKNVGSYAGAVA